jgi:hypothetical protein
MRRRVSNLARMRWELLSLVLVGPAVGTLGRTAVSGPRPLPWWRASAVGLAGALTGGLPAAVALGPAHPVTVPVVASVFAAMFVLGAAGYRRIRTAAAPPE